MRIRKAVGGLGGFLVHSRNLLGFHKFPADSQNNFLAHNAFNICFQASGEHGYTILPHALGQVLFHLKNNKNIAFCRRKHRSGSITGKQFFQKMYGHRLIHPVFPIPVIL